MNRLRVGLVGAGRRGQAHLSTILGMPDLYELTAVCDPADFNARVTAERFSGAIYADVGEFFARERLDAVVIATPPESHTSWPTRQRIGAYTYSSSRRSPRRGP